MASKRITKRKVIKRGGGKRYKKNKITRKRYYGGVDENDEIQMQSNFTKQRRIDNITQKYEKKLKPINDNAAIRIQEELKQKELERIQRETYANNNNYNWYQYH
jgi:hypothetical protein